jgi:probable addiction module antidote protein
MAIETTPFNPDKYFDSTEARIHLLNDALASGNPGYIADAVGVIARRHGIADIAARTGLNRQALYAALGEEGNPTLSTVLKVFAALDLELTVRRKDAA